MYQNRYSISFKDVQFEHGRSNSKYAQDRLMHLASLMYHTRRQCWLIDNS